MTTLVRLKYWHWGQTKKVSSRSEMITEGWTGPERALWAFILHVCRTEYILDWNFAGKGAIVVYRNYSAKFRAVSCCSITY